MDNDVSAGSTTTIVGRLALGITLLAFGLGNSGLIDGVTAADAVSLAHYVGGVALFVAGLFAFRDRDTVTGTAFSALGALWFTWAVSMRRPGLRQRGRTVPAAVRAGGAVPHRGRRRPARQGHVRAVPGLPGPVGHRYFADNDGLAKVGGWFAVAAGAVAWYAATAALAQWPTALPRRAARRGVTVAG